MKKLLALVLAAAMALSLAACGGGSAPSAGGGTGNGAGNSDLPVLRVAAMPTITSLPTYYIQKNGLAEKAGFRMEITMFDTGAPMNEALAADLWDVGAMGAAAVTGMANYDEMVIGEVLESTDGQGVFVKPDSPIAKDTGYNPSFPTVLGSPDTVKGITILTPVGTAQHFTILKWLEKLGLEATDVNIVNMDTVQAYQAMQAGQCDAVSLNVPTFFDAVNDGMVQVANLADLGTRYVDMVVANRKAVEGKADLIEKYMECLLEANAALQNDQEMATDLFMEFLKENGMETTRENCVSDLQRAKFLVKEDWKGRELGNFAKELGEFYVGQGQLDASAIDKFTTNVDNTFVKGYQQG
ncbi:ABC transporter substrate-binding protein [Allofournierella sp.]|uniref:ABC transporter substrate-binding protein n=2 Tax=Allofournierella sp. TaxID=1940256 RepID=UPI003AB4E438